MNMAQAVINPPMNKLNMLPRPIKTQQQASALLAVMYKDMVATFFKVVYIKANTLCTSQVQPNCHYAELQLVLLALYSRIRRKDKDYQLIN
ncbi:hypothetical protein L195_g008789 [Trifolium pratense]|uniref:Uncharacterized protein n=1 Tax=Trifolium pratense TaxID=57577 RepID=A0A2K3PA56_TRIPR|nr:hypothetical protein L195_g008789 [Trifolium pratense]